MEPTARALPHDIDVEKAVLSALLHDNTAIHAVLNEVKPEDFYHPAHQQLYRSMTVSYTHLTLPTICSV